MLIEIHMIQNHSPSNLNRDDLGAPKTCYFGGVLRSRISSQCIKRSIRTSDEFKDLLGGVRTRQLAKLIAEKSNGGAAAEARTAKILELCGFKPKAAKKSISEEGSAENKDTSKMLVYTTWQAIQSMAKLLHDNPGKKDEQLAEQFAKIIAEGNATPDMALSGRMLEADSKVWEKFETKVEAALQVAHAISTHEARPEVDYYVAKDDVPGADAGAGYVAEAMFASACFYKYFSIHWETLLDNLQGDINLAAHTVGAFIRGAAMVNPTGKQNSFAAHNPPDGTLIEMRKTPISYANAFAKPTLQGDRDIISQSIAQMAQYVHDLDTGYGKPQQRFWFSPNLRYPLAVVDNKQEVLLGGHNIKSLDELIPEVIKAIGYDWEEVKKAVVNLTEKP